METTAYCDFSHVNRYEVTCEAASLKKQRSFPIVLHEILSRSEEFGEAICWLPHGRAWKILRDDLLVENVLPIFFNHKSRASFLRQVNNWNFKRVLHGPDENAYYHEKFLRGLPHVSFLMKQSQSERRKNPSAKKSDHSIVSRMLDIPPDFYAITKEHPLPDACAFRPSLSSTGFTSASETTTTTATAPDGDWPYADASNFHRMGVNSDHSANRNCAEKRVSFSMAPLTLARQNDASENHAPVAQNREMTLDSSSGVSLFRNEAIEHYHQHQLQYFQQHHQQQDSTKPQVNQEILQQASTDPNQPTQTIAIQSSNFDGRGHPVPSTGLAFGGYNFNHSNSFMPHMTTSSGVITHSTLSSPQLQQPALFPPSIQTEQIQNQQQIPQ
ncbi:hypothetical protein ACHAXS_001731, partial [Conticribra weissflogii]